ncbi:MAG: transcription termination factor NusA [Armatimonadetes bacterium]|nr:transcription termination factor NusA [Armatimonadota bacterium]
MNADFLDALRQIEKEKEIPLEVLLSAIETALETAYKKNFAAIGDVRVRVSSSKGGFHVFCEKDVVETVENEHTELTVAEARKHNPDAVIGDAIEIEVTPENFGRIAAQTAKQVVVQRIREAERERVYEEFGERVGEVITCTVQRREQRNVFVNLGKVEALLPPAEQVPTEPYRFNDRVKVYVLEVRRTPKGPQVVVSRTHPSLIRRLFELEVPEIAEGIVTIKSVAREPGARTKVAVHSSDDKVDAMGACVGHRGTRVQSVVNELYGEKIDIVRWNENIEKFIGEALSPAKSISVKCDESTKTALVIMPDSQLSLAIGKSGQNVRLAARLTGWRIDIRSESQLARAALTGEDISAVVAEVDAPPVEIEEPAEIEIVEEVAEVANDEVQELDLDTEPETLDRVITLKDIKMPAESKPTAEPAES